MRFSLLVGAIAAVSAVAAESTPVPESARKVANKYITRATLEAPIRFLSSDLLEGRGPGTRGDELARLYLQTQLESMGYRPAFPEGEWQQPVPIVGIKRVF